MDDIVKLIYDKIISLVLYNLEAWYELVIELFSISDKIALKADDNIFTAAHIWSQVYFFTHN